MVAAGRVDLSAANTTLERRTGFRVLLYQARRGVACEGGALVQDACVCQRFHFRLPSPGLCNRADRDGCGSDFCGGMLAGDWKHLHLSLTACTGRSAGKCRARLRRAAKPTLRSAQGRLFVG